MNKRRIPVRVGQRRVAPGGHVYKVVSIERVTEFATGKVEDFAGVAYEDPSRNMGHPLNRLWPVKCMINDKLISEVAPENRARVTAGPDWMRV